MPKKKVSERRSGLSPSEKQLPERRFEQVTGRCRKPHNEELQN
jgi:hypothetical protein